MRRARAPATTRLRKWAFKVARTGTRTTGRRRQRARDAHGHRYVRKPENNDLASLKLFLDENGGDINSYVNSIEYSYNVVPQIFDGNTEDGVRQINPDTTFSAFGMGSGSSNALMSSMYSTDVFSEMMGNTAIVEEQYDVKAGRWPSAYNECVVVLTANGTVPDLVSYALGLRDHAVLEDMIDQFMNEEDVESPDDNLTFTYDEIMGVSLKMVPAADFYTCDEENKVWVDKTGDEEYMKGLVDAGEELKIVGIVQPRPDAKATALSMGIYYTPELTRHLIEQASETAIVQEQLNYPTIDVFNGKDFTEEEESGSDFSMENLFSIDEEALQNAFKFDESKLNMDTSALGEGCRRAICRRCRARCKCVEPGCDLRLQQRRHGR